MRRLSALLSSVAAVAAVVMLAVAAAGATQGTAVYRVQGSDLSAAAGTAGSSASTGSFTVTETVSPGTNASFDTLLLAVAAHSGNFTYSRLVNASSEVQPFLPAITNQSFTYGENGTSVTASISSNGTVPLAFQGGTYTLTSYAYSLEITSAMPSFAGLNLTGMNLTGLNLTSGEIGSLGLASQTPTLMATNETTTLTGTVYAFQSGLVYSVKGEVKGVASFSITLLSTTLPLNTGGASAMMQAASLGVGAGAIGGALALGLGVRHRHQQKRTGEAKPDHWVD